MTSRTSSSHIGVTRARDTSYMHELVMVVTVAAHVAKGAAVNGPTDNGCRAGDAEARGG